MVGLPESTLFLGEVTLLLVLPALSLTWTLQVLPLAVPVVQLYTIVLALVVLTQVPATGLVDNPALPVSVQVIWKVVVPA